MARIPDDLIQRLKSEISLKRLVESSGIELKKQGKDWFGRCPFHEDKTPSLSITPAKNVWHCLGACQQGGDVFRWVEKLHGVSFTQAFHMLHEQSPALAANTALVKKSTTPKLDNPFNSAIEAQQLLNQVINYYHETLKQNPDALAYLEKRGIADSDVIDTFKLGLSNRSLGYRLPQANRKDGAAIRTQLQKIGLYRASGHEHFSGSIVIPVMDEHGNVQEVYGRKLIDRLRAGTPKHCYLPGPHKGIFNSVALHASNEIILCESLIDALTFWCNGYRNVTTSYGIEGFTKEHLQQFKQHQIERVLIAYDRDEAGEGAANKLSKQLIKAGIDCYRINFPKGMDVNDYALSMTPASKALGVVIRSAVWLGTGKKKPITTKSINNKSTKEENNIKDNESSLAAEPEEVVNEVLPASPLPEASKETLSVETNDNEIIITLADRRYRIRGINKNLGYDSLKVNVMVSSESGMHIDTLDLYQSRPKITFSKQAAIELCVNSDVIKTDLGKVLLKCETLQEDNIKQTQTPKPTTHQLTDKEQKDAIKLLQSKHLLKRIQKDFNQCGIVGEATNTLVGYLASVSRKLDNPLAVIIQSTSAAGKSSLMDAVLRFIPEEDRTQYSAMTGQSLFYMGETDLKHKVLAIVEEEGASQAAYALKLLQSEGQLTIASTSKDPDTGKLVTQEYKVEGPVMIFLTTTAIEVDEELMNRCLVLTVNEDREQTQAIHEIQRKKRTLEGLIQKSERETLLNVHQNAQRLLKRLSVVNPYAEQLTFLNNQTRTRRDHEKYLTLIDSIALLHQYQRQVKTIKQGDRTIEYIEATLNDIEIANQLAHEVLGRTLDELPPQTRKLLTLIDAMVTEHCQKQNKDRNHYHFSRREIREYTEWSDGQLKIHCYRLQELEYLLVHSGGRGKTIQYELLYDGQDEDKQHHLMGLIDTNTLKQQYDVQKIGQKQQKTGSSQGQDRLKSGGCQGNENKLKRNGSNDSSVIDDDLAENAYIRKKDNGASYTQTPSLLAASK